MGSPTTDILRFLDRIFRYKWGTSPGPNTLSGGRASGDPIAFRPPKNGAESSAFPQALLVRVAALDQSSADPETARHSCVPKLSMRLAGSLLSWFCSRSRVW